MITEPPNAIVHVNGAERGTTPFTYTYRPADGDQGLLDLELAGYDKTSISIKPKRNNAVLFMDAMLLQIPYIVDRGIDPRCTAFRGRITSSISSRKLIRMLNVSWCR